MTVPKCFCANALTGGADGALDAIDGTSLNDGDFAYVMHTDGTKYFYTLDASSGASEDSPYIISPDSNANDKRWITHTMSGPVITFRGLFAGSDSATISTATYTPIVFNSTSWNVGSYFSTVTGEFTAPIDGYYSFAWSLKLVDVDASATYYTVRLVTSNLTLWHIPAYGSSLELSADSSNVTLVGSSPAWLDEDDTAYLDIYQQGGAAQTEVGIGSAFTGFRIG